MWSSENPAPAGAPPISTQVPRMPTESAACRTTSMTPVHSRLASAGPSQISCTAATGSTPAATSIVSVAPSSRASRSRDASRSTATIVVAPVSRAAITAESPTAPAPNTTTEEPTGGRSALSTAPAPVPIPQARGPRIATGASAATGTSDEAGQIEYVANEDWPK